MGRTSFKAIIHAITGQGGRGRRQFLLDIMPKHSVCAEIGVLEGDFSERILEVVKPRKFHLIDPWKYESAEVYGGAFYGGKAGSQETMDEMARRVKERFQREIDGGIVTIHRNNSVDTSPDFPDDYFDWIYIDGNHLYEYVKKDLELYYDKVKRGGFLTGDDYAGGGWWKGGVRKAVDEFVQKRSAKLVMIKNNQFILRKI